MLVKCTREIAGEYVRAGETYTVEQEGKGNRRRYHFRNVVTGGGTSMAGWAFSAAVRAGQLVPFDPLAAAQ